MDNVTDGNWICVLSTLQKPNCLSKLLGYYSYMTILPMLI